MPEHYYYCKTTLAILSSPYLNYPKGSTFYDFLKMAVKTIDKGVKWVYYRSINKKEE